MPVSASRPLVTDRALWREREHGACQSESGVAVAWLGLGLKTPAYPSPWRLPIYCFLWNSCMYIWLLLFEYWTLLVALLYLLKKLILHPFKLKLGHYVKWQKFRGSLSHAILGGMPVTALHLVICCLFVETATPPLPQDGAVRILRVRCLFKDLNQTPSLLFHSVSSNLFEVDYFLLFFLLLIILPFYCEIGSPNTDMLSYRRFTSSLNCDLYV